MLRVSPERPREHVLEELFERAFRELMPAEWVVRDVAGDYGIDLEVEIFEEGVAAGLTFKVQLKASDRVAEAGPFRTVRRAHVHYWNRLDVPVLLTYFVQETGETYGRWVHSIGREPGRKPDTASIRVAFSTEDVLRGQSDRLVRDVLLVRQLRSGSVPQPLPVRLTVDGYFAHHTQAEVVVRLRNLLRLRGLRDHVSVASAAAAGDPSAVELRVIGGKSTVLRAALPVDLATVRCVYPKDAYAGEDGLRILVSPTLSASRPGNCCTRTPGPVDRLRSSRRHRVRRRVSRGSGNSVKPGQGPTQREQTSACPVGTRPRFRWRNSGGYSMRVSLASGSRGRRTRLVSCIRTSVMTGLG